MYWQFFSLILILNAPFFPYAQTNPVEVLIADGSSSPSNDDFFEPSQITVAKGTTVKWINQDSTLHTVTSGKPNEGNSGTEFDSSYFAAGKTFQHQFSTAGTFDYYCTLHPFMSGKVRVTANAILQSNPSSSSSEVRRKIDLVTYNLVNKLGMPRSGEGQFNHPAAIAIQ